MPGKLFPCALAVCATLCLLTASANAQDGETRQRLVRQSAAVLTNEDLSSVEAEAAKPVVTEDIRPAKSSTFKATGNRFEQLMSAAIDERLGANYSWGGTGPSGFDCSGFVWSIFNAAGINFERASARTLWGRFEAPVENEKFKFGTLVFFSGLSHIGIVADEHGFYHASRHHGVVYSPFNDYWTSRIDGFRRVPMTAKTTIAKATTD
jgi:cell wall-associated NlpC family hydrolase